MRPVDVQEAGQVDSMLYDTCTLESNFLKSTFWGIRSPNLGLEVPNVDAFGPPSLLGRICIRHFLAEIGRSNPFISKSWIIQSASLVQDRANLSDFLFVRVHRHVRTHCLFCLFCFRQSFKNQGPWVVLLTFVRLERELVGVVLDRLELLLGPLASNKGGEADK